MTATDSVTGLEDAYPLTALQAGMLFHSAYQDDSATYHDVFTLMLRGTYRSEVFRSALADVMARHAVLRTSFDLTGFDAPIRLNDRFDRRQLVGARHQVQNLPFFFTVWIPNLQLEHEAVNLRLG